MLFRRIRAGLLVSALLGALVLTATACGGGGSGGAASGTASGAEVAPASVPLFVSINTDVDSGQWDAVNKLLDKFPGRDKLLTQMRQGIRKDSGLDWQTDVKPALGPELDVVVLDFDAGGHAVALTQPKDEDKFNAAIKKENANSTANEQLVTRKVGDWTLISNNTANIDRFESASGGKLADDDTFKTATGELDDETLVKVYANGAKVSDALRNLAARAGASAPPNGKLDWGAAQLVAQDEGMRFDGFFKGSGGATRTPKPYKAKLLANVPSGALVVLDFRGGPQNLSQLNQAGFNQVPQLQGVMNVLKTVSPIFANENALYVRQGTPFPEVTLIAQPSNPQQGVATIDRLIAQLAPLAGASATPKSTQIAGVTVKEVTIGNVAIDYGVVSGKLVVTSSRTGIESVKSGGSSLTNDGAFKDAKSAAGMPDDTSGFIYVNLKDGIPVLENFAQLGGANEPAEVRENLRPLKSFVYYGTTEGGGKTKVTAFLQVK